MSDDVYENYLRDIGTLLREEAIRAKGSPNASEPEFQAGVRFAYVSVLSMMQSQARAFNIPLDKIGLEGLDPETELL
jgi:hypothetical protein